MKSDHRSKFSNLSNRKEEAVTGIAAVTGSNPVEGLIFSGFFFPIT